MDKAAAARYRAALRVRCQDNRDHRKALIRAAIGLQAIAGFGRLTTTLSDQEIGDQCGWPGRHRWRCLHAEERAGLASIAGAKPSRSPERWRPRPPAGQGARTAGPRI